MAEVLFTPERRAERQDHFPGRPGMSIATQPDRVTGYPDRIPAFRHSRDLDVMVEPPADVCGLATFICQPGQPFAHPARYRVRTLKCGRQFRDFGSQPVSPGLLDQITRVDERLEQVKRRGEREASASV